MLSLVISLLAGLVIAGVLAWRLNTLLPTVVSYALHAVAAVGIFATMGLAAPDAVHYSEQAGQLLSGQPDRPVTPGKELFTYLLTFIYSTVGIQPGIVIALNVLLVAALPTVLGQAAAALRMPVKLSMWAGALVPQTLFWGVILLRESMVWFAMLLVVLALAKLYAGGRWPVWVPVLVGALVLFTYTRGTIAIVLAAAAVVVLLIVVRSWKLPVMTGAALGVLMLILPGFSNILIKFSSDSEDAAGRVPTSGTDAVAAPSSAGEDHTSSTIFHAPHFDNGFINLMSTKATALLNVVFGPLPTDFGKVSVVYFADGFVWLVVLGFAIFGWTKLTDKRSSLVLLIPAALIILSMGWTLFEYGTLIRLRIMPLLILLPLAAHGFACFWGWFRAIIARRSLTATASNRR